MNKIIYFKGLNGIRAIAVIIVVIWHTDQFAEQLGLLSKKFYLSGMAIRAVDMFFVLSGFLITYLLLKEKEKTNTIDINKFYIRRILRIWPLYYIMIFVSLILIYVDIVPDVDDLFTSVIFYTFLMANISYLFHIDIKSITQLWSVGVEEQFYLIWPHLIKRTTNYFTIFIAIFIGGCALRIIAFYTLRNVYPYLIDFLYMFRINIMALGALGALLYFKGHSYLKIIYRKELQIVSWAVLIYSIVIEPIHLRGYVNAEINSLFYFIIILNVATNSKSIISLETRLLDLIGKYSYGIYMYHMLVIYLFSYFISRFNLEFNYYVIQFLVLITTFFISKYSYKFIEKPFLNLKNNYAIIKSSNQQFK